MEADFKFLARPGFAVREVAGETVLVPIDTSNVSLSGGGQLDSFNGMVSLNGLGLFLWQQLEEPKSLEELISLVEARYDTAGQDITADIQEFLNTGIVHQIIFLTKAE